ncbi:MAG: lamin tail domain-containing protein [bacterium]|nr:lamin tail domain-containing protein [bacterium]
MKHLAWLLAAGLVCTARAGIHFNEVCYDPEGVDTGQEWIELINTGTEPVSLDGWLLDCNGPNLILPAVQLGPGQVLVIHNNAVEALPHTQQEVWFAGPSLGNTHGFLGLWRSDAQNLGNLVDYLQYGQVGHSWEGQAIEAGLWPAGAFLPDVEQGHSLHYRGTGLGPEAWYDEAEPVPGQTQTTVGAVDPADRPAQLNLLAWPNPFNPSTRVSFVLPETGDVRLSLMDMLGREVRLLADGRLGPGLHEMGLDMDGQPAGPYFVHLRAGDQSAVSKILLVR